MSKSGGPVLIFWPWQGRPGWSILAGLAQHTRSRASYGGPLDPDNFGERYIITALGRIAIKTPRKRVAGLEFEVQKNISRASRATIPG
jgi:hypothetical protein